MKKLLLGLGTLASVAAPVAAVIACGSGASTNYGTQLSETETKAYVNTAGKATIAKISTSSFNTLFNGADVSAFATTVEPKVYENGDNVVLVLDGANKKADASDEASDDVTAPTAPVNELNFVSIETVKATGAIVNINVVITSNGNKNTTDYKVNNEGKLSYKFDDDTKTVVGISSTDLTIPEVATAITALEKTREAAKPVVDTTTTDTTTTGGDKPTVQKPVEVKVDSTHAIAAEVAKINAVGLTNLTAEEQAAESDASVVTAATDAFTAFEQAKTDAIAALNALPTTTPAAIVTTKGTEQLALVKAAEKAFLDLAKPIQAKAAAAKGIDATRTDKIALLTALTTKPGVDGTEADIAAALTTATTAINGATETTIAAVYHDQESLINAAIAKAKADKELAANKAADKTTIGALAVSEDPANDPKLFPAIQAAIDAAKTAIDGAADAGSLATIVKDETAKVQTAVNAYTSSSSTTAVAQAQAGDSIEVDVTIKADDFKNHIDALIAQAIATKLGKQLDVEIVKIKKLKVKVTDESSATFEQETTVLNVAGETATEAFARINGAIARVSEAIAKDSSMSHDISMEADDYATKMLARVNAIDDKLTGYNLANAILGAIGNATKFSSDTKYKPVFAIETTVTGTLKEEVTKFVTPYLTLEVSETNLVDAINALLGKL